MANKTSGAAMAASTIVAIVAALAVAGTGSFMIGRRMGEKSASVNSDTVATYSGGQISKLDLYNRMKDQGGAKLVAQMIDEKLIDQEAQKAGVSLTTADYDGEIAKLKDRFGGDAGLQSALEGQGLTMDKLKEILAPQIKAVKIISKDMQPKDDELKKYFDDNIATYDTKKQVHASHILVATEQEANDIKAELDKGGDFAALAKAKSTDPGTKEKAGDLDTFGRGKMDPAFDKVVFGLKAGEVSAPFSTTFGWHIAKVLEIKAESVTFDAVKEKVKSDFVHEQATTKLDAWLQALRDKAAVKNDLEPKK